jgi:predicted PhzF superfamily epimerase YddE/YHI9
MRGGVLPVRVSGPAEALQIQLASPPARQLDDGATRHRSTAGAGRQRARARTLGQRRTLVAAAAARRRRRARPGAGHGRPARLEPATDATGVAVFADEAGTDHTRVVRAFCPADAASVPEDPVTGSANALIGAWLRQRNALPGREGRYVASQGREVGRDGRVQVEVDAQGTVWIGGQVQPVIDGHHPLVAHGTDGECRARPPSPVPRATLCRLFTGVPA